WLMMSLWDALRMNMMISYQELVRTFPKFESFYHKVGDNDGYVCGNVNAKNSYGGYTGRKEYFVFIETESGKLKNNGPVTIVSDSDSNALEKYKLFCQ
ncbi:hypothetical protein DMP70_25800, partial [Klebsiella pneumoniae]